MATFVVPANNGTYVQNAEGALTEVIAWEIDPPPPNLEVNALHPENFTPTHIILPDGRRFTYPGWERDGWGP